ncbi:MAG: FtsX-like permease family protein, partial [Thermoleophilia bacterium]|nr:FtsX-like permease family protein [Thermoleophilia bacterium]
FDTEGQFTAITATAVDGVDQDVLRDRVAGVLPAEVEAITGEQAASEDSAEIQEAVSILRNVVLGFGAVALLVSTFVIFNVFSITVAQRTRQLGLLRAVGASGAQVRRMVIVEALVIGVAASVIGLAAGVLLALGLLEFFRLADIDLPTTRPELKPRTIAWGLAVGIIVTLIAAFVPALRASRVSPVSAMRESTSEESRVSLRVRIIAFVLPALGIVLLSWGLWGSLDLAPRLTIMGFGALLLFVGAAALTALIARPVVAVIGFPARRIAGVSGKLASENVVRKPGRTASAAAALTIGVALVAFSAVFAFSLRASFDDILERQFKSDFLAFVDGGDENPAFTPEFADRIEELPEIGVVSRWRSGDFAEPDSLDSTSELFGVEPEVLEQIYDPELLEGRIVGLGPNEVLVQSSAADDRDLGLGDTFTMVFEETGAQDFTVAGIFDDTTFANYMISLEGHDANFDQDADSFVLAKIATGVQPEAAELAFDRAAADFPQLTAQSNQEFRDAAANDINQLLNVINGMLFMAILIAILGIIATLFLAVYERTREIGLLRAVGLSQRQVFGMVTWESVMTALLGALIGVVLGVILGALIIQRLSDDFPVLDIPFTLIVVYLVAAGIVGVLAAISPAIIAARMNILKAIQTE